MDNKSTLYARWLSGELLPEELESLKTSGELEELEAIVRASDRLSTPEYDVDSAFANLMSSKPKRRTSNVVGISMWWTAAAAIVLIGLGLWWFTPMSSDYSAPMAQSIDINLEDGTQITLNDGSNLSYKEFRFSDKRVVELEGEALFEVTSGRPFEVKTNKGSIHVLGTEFNVEAWGSRMEVTCFEGRVQVMVSHQEVVLSAGQSVQVENQVFSDIESVLVEQPSWMTGVSSFSNESISEVFDELGRQFDVRIESDVANRKFSGQFRHDDLQSAVEAVCLPLGLPFDIDVDAKVVRIFSE